MKLFSPFTISGYNQSSWISYFNKATSPLRFIWNKWNSLDETKKLVTKVALGVIGGTAAAVMFYTPKNESLPNVKPITTLTPSTPPPKFTPPTSFPSVPKDNLVGQDIPLMHQICLVIFTVVVGIFCLKMAENDALGPKNLPKNNNMPKNNNIKTKTLSRWTKAEDPNSQKTQGPSDKPTLKKLPNPNETTTEVPIVLSEPIDPEKPKEIPKNDETNDNEGTTKIQVSDPELIDPEKTKEISKNDEIKDNEDTTKIQESNPVLIDPEKTKDPQKSKAQTKPTISRKEKKTG